MVAPEVNVVPPVLPLLGLKLLTDGRVTQVTRFILSNECVTVRSMVASVVRRDVMSDAAIVPVIGSAEARRFP